MLFSIMLAVISTPTLAVPDMSSASYSDSLSQIHPEIAFNALENNTSNYTKFNNSSISYNESIRATMLKMPLSFIENRGQSSEDVEFMVKTAGQTVFFTHSEIVFALSNKNNSSVVRMSFEDSRPGKITGEELLPGMANFFIGNDSSKWVQDIPTYAAISYKDIYPGVDLVFKGTEEHLKHELILSPGTDPAQIVVNCSGQDNLSLAQDGSVLIRTATGNITDSAPFCYQEINGTQVIIDSKYRMIDGHRIGFHIETYNKSYPLMIDPVLEYSTYLGGGSSESASSIAVDSSGSAYVAGPTGSTNFPTQNPYQGTNAGGDYDAFVTKLGPGGSALSYSTYLGGSGSDYARSIAVDSSGSVYVAGYTSSTNFPTQNPYQGTNAGGYSDAFISKLGSGGNALSYSTYLGGGSYDSASGIAVDSSRSAYVAGYTSSTNFPTQNPYQGTNAGSSDAFITKLVPGGNALSYSTYLGGGSDDYAYGIAVDSSGSAYVAGETRSTNLPTQNPYQSTNAGGSDAFISKLGPGGNALSYSTYMGGGGYSDLASGIAVDSSGSVYVAGSTSSTNFPTQNPYQGTYAGDQDAFISKLGPGGNALSYSTYLGGGSSDYAYGIAVDSSGSAYVAGFTYSTNFPTQNPYQSTNAGFRDAFISKLGPGGSALSYSTYLGGGDFDYAYGIAVDSSGSAYVAGYTYSTDFPTQNPYQGTFAGDADAFITKLSPYNPGWEGLGGIVSSNPSMIKDNQGRTHIFVKGGDNALWDNLDGTWQFLGGVITSDPYAVKDSAGAVHVLVRGSDNALWDRALDGGWTNLGGAISSSPSAALALDNHIKVAVKGMDNALWLKDMTTGDWMPLGGVITSNPQAIRDANGKIHVYALGGDSALWDNIDGSWVPRGGVLTSDPRPCQNPSNPGYIYIFVRGGDGSLWRNDLDTNSNTATWNELGGILAPNGGSIDMGNPAPVTDDNGVLHAFVQGTDGALWDNANGVWQGLGGIIKSSPNAIRDENGWLKVAAVGGDNALWIYRLRPD